MPNLTPEQLRAALERLAADDSENSFGDAVAQVVAHGDRCSHGVRPLLKYPDTKPRPFTQV
jgi:hypothetical protein